MRFQIADTLIFMPDHALLQLVITKRSDIPDLREVFVMRPVFVMEGLVIPLEESWVRPTLEGVRRLVPDGLVCIPRFPEDAPEIVEVWT